MFAAHKLLNEDARGSLLVLRKDLRRNRITPDGNVTANWKTRGGVKLLEDFALSWNRNPLKAIMKALFLFFRLGIGVLGLGSSLAIQAEPVLVLAENFDATAVRQVPAAWRALGGTDRFQPGASAFRKDQYGYTFGHTLALTQPFLEPAGMVGAAFWEMPLDLRHNRLRIEFDLLISPGTTDLPADGLSLLLLPFLPNQPGQGGGNLGRYGQGGIVVEFDIWDNGEFDPEDMAATTGGGVSLVDPATRAVSVALDRMQDGFLMPPLVEHDAEGHPSVYPHCPDFVFPAGRGMNVAAHVWVVYDHGLITVEMEVKNGRPWEGFPRRTVLAGAVGPWEFHSAICPFAFLGFSGATGGANALQEIDNLQIWLDPAMGPAQYPGGLEPASLPPTLDPRGKAANAGAGLEPGWNVKGIKLNRDQGHWDLDGGSTEAILSKVAWALSHLPATAQEQPQVINYSQAPGAGLFANDRPYPGESHSGTTDHYALRCEGFVEFTQTGHYAIGVNSDDGFLMWLGGSLVAAAGSRGTTLTWHQFLVAEAGLYPLRVDHWEGVGEANVEVVIAAIPMCEPFPGPVLLNDPESRQSPRLYRSVRGASIPSPALPWWKWIPASARVGMPGSGLRAGWEYHLVKVDSARQILNDWTQAAQALADLPSSLVAVIDRVSGNSPIINFGAGSDGYFASDAPFPGGSGDDLAMRARGFLEVPQPGVIALFVNSDDGFRSGVGATTLRVAGIKGQSDMDSFFLIDQPGLYPFEVIWFERGGAENFEIHHWTPQGAFLVGDRADPSGVKIWLNASGEASAAWPWSPSYQVRLGDPSFPPQTCQEGYGFKVRVVKSPDFWPLDLDSAEHLLQGLNPPAWEVNQKSEVLDFVDSGPPGHFDSRAPFPGLEALSANNNDYFALEATGWIELTPGTHIFGINSDDGFRLEVGGQVVAEYRDLRAVSVTFGSVTVTQPGLYPLRLVYWEGWGDASLELLYVDSNGLMHLVNQASDPQTLRVCPSGRQPTTLPDLVVTRLWNQQGTICYELRNQGEGTAPAGHTTAFLDRDQVVRDSVLTPLAPKQIYQGCFHVSWQCAGSTATLQVQADYENGVIESNETNNILLETWSCVVPSPNIIGGPEVQQLTSQSTTLLWQTDQPGDSQVYYSQQSRGSEIQVVQAEKILRHSVILSNLHPYTVYRFWVQSQDAQGRIARSREMAFQTLPRADERDPQVILQWNDAADPSQLRGVARVAADASDNQGLQKVEFYMDNVLVFTAFSPPYDYELDTSKYANGTHQFEVMALDWSGRKTRQVTEIIVANYIDRTAPVATITNPLAQQTVQGVITIKADLSDDTGLKSAYVYINGIYSAFEPFPLYPLKTQIELEWDTWQLTNGPYRVGIMTYDKDNKATLTTVDVSVNNPPPSAQPNLIISKHELTRHQNTFVVKLEVANVGGGTASNLVIQDSFTAFQATERTDLLNGPAQYGATYQHLTKLGLCNIKALLDIPPNGTATFSFPLVPVLTHPLPPAPSIGHGISLDYLGPGGKSHSKTLTAAIVQTTQGEALGTAFTKAVQEADYLIVTHPGNLHVHNLTQSDEVNHLLVEMAQLAIFQYGVLGYLDTNDRNTLDALVTPAGGWGSQLHANFRIAAQGYLLLVGEVEIIPSWRRAGWNLTWSNFACTTREVDTTDLPYADTGGSGAPELIVGRAIGNTATALRRVIQTSNRVYEKHPGYGFARSKSLLVSGTDGNAGIQSAFTGFINDAEKLIQSEFQVTKIHWSTIQASQQVPQFRGNAAGQDVVVYQGHGGPDGWGALSTTDVLGNPAANPPIAALSFGSKNPVALAWCCLSGSYEDHVANNPCTFDGGDANIAEALLEARAAVFIGATEVSPISLNAEGGKAFFDKWWKAYQTVGKALTDLKRDRWNQSDLWRFWITEYNLYGDPKYGAAHSGTAGAAPTQLARAAGPPPSEIQVLVRGYEVARREGRDYLTIPDGDLILDTGRYQLPYVTVSRDIPAGYMVREVVLDRQSDWTSRSGFAIPVAENNIAGLDASGQKAVPVVETFWPQETFRWEVLDNPDGSSLLQIMVYALQYHPATSTIQFASNFVFHVDYGPSDVSVPELKTDQAEYAPGQPIQIQVGLRNQGPSQDCLVQGWIQWEGDPLKSYGLPLRLLRGVAGAGDFTLALDPKLLPGIPQEPGRYLLQITLSDPNHPQLRPLARQNHWFTVGRARAQVSLSLQPNQLAAQTTSVKVRVGCANTGDQALDGRLHVSFVDERGHEYLRQSYPLAGIAPGASATQEAMVSIPRTDLSYQAVAYAQFNSQATDPVVASLDALLPAINLNISRNSDGSLALRWTPFGAGSYTVQYCDDLGGATWRDLPGASFLSTTRWVEPASRLAPCRFYRVIAVVPPPAPQSVDPSRDLLLDHPDFRGNFGLAFPNLDAVPATLDSNKDWVLNGDQCPERIMHTVHNGSYDDDFDYLRAVMTFDYSFDTGLNTMINPEREAAGNLVASDFDKKSPHAPFDFPQDVPGPHPGPPTHPPGSCP